MSATAAQELHGTGNIPAGYNNLDEPAFVEASRWLQRNAKLFNKDRLTVNRYWLLRNILGELKSAMTLCFGLAAVSNVAALAEWVSSISLIPRIRH